MPWVQILYSKRNVFLSRVASFQECTKFLFIGEVINSKKSAFRKVLEMH